jgi:hypothetical protein
MLARWLRRTASRSLDSDPLRRLNDPLLHYRAAAVRTELLEIAAMVERAQNPDPACLVALHGLLANGCDSPLYNSRVPHSTLLEILRAAREGLAEDRERSNRVGTDSGGAARPERAA